VRIVAKNKISSVT